MSAPRKPYCALARVIAEPLDKTKIKRDGWQKHQILVVSLDDPALGMIDREFVKQIGEKLYGSKPRRG